MALISVTVPVYKVEPYLRRCVDSILGQTFTDFELILVDDGSPDGCPAICDEYAAQDSRVVVIHQENGGLSAARNAGIDWAFANSDSQWLTFIDSDDWVHPEFLERLIMAAQKYQVTVSCCYFQRVLEGEAPDEINDSNAILSETVDVYCSDDGVGVCAYSWRFLFHRSLFGDVRFPSKKIYEDIFTTYKLIFRSANVAVVDQGLYYYFFRETSITHAGWSPKQMDIIEAYEDNLQFFEDFSSQKLANCLTRGYLTAIHSQYSKMQESDITAYEKYTYGKILKKKMKAALWIYGQQAHVKLETHGYLVALAYPHLMQLYWFIKGQLKKLCK